MSASSHAPAPAPAPAPGGFHDEKAPDAKKPAAKLFVECLENEGCKVIFGLPGEENADFVLALQDSSIRYILVRQEQGAAFMADAYGRLTQQPGERGARTGE
jgi:acetolactate synthase-1/2/3 large subunit